MFEDVPVDEFIKGKEPRSNDRREERQASEMEVHKESDSEVSCEGGVGLTPDVRVDKELEVFYAAEHVESGVQEIGLESSRENHLRDGVEE